MAEFGRIAATRAGVAHRPAALEDHLTAQVDAGDAAAADERTVRPVARHPFADAVPRPPCRHARGPRLDGRTVPGAGPVADLRIAVQQEQIVDVVEADRCED